MTRTSIVVAAAALAALLAAGPAAAQNSGWYIGGGPGLTKAKFERGDFISLASTGTYSVDDEDVAPRVFGGYRITPYWGVEFGFTVLGRFKHRFQSGANNASYDYEASALHAALAAHLPLGGGVSVNGRGGLAFTAANLSLAVDNGGIATPRTCEDAWWYSDCTSANTNLFWGVGLQFDVSRRWGIRLDYDDYGTVGDEFESGRADMTQVSINVLFNF